MPEIGINLISQGELNKETYTILTYKHIIIKQKNKVITKGKKLRNLYYLPIKVINNKDQILNTSTNSTNNNNNFIWHQRLGHINNECLKRLDLSTLGSNINTSNY